MKDQVKAKFFLAQERGVEETAHFSILNTFNSGIFFHEHKQPFGNIYQVNDDSLDAGCSMDIHLEKYSYLILPPVMGAITVEKPACPKGILAAGQLQVIISDKEETFTIRNPFKEGVVNFLQIAIRDDKAITDRVSSISEYDINNCPNELIKISPGKGDTSLFPFAICIGKFDGREETIFPLKNKNSGAFALIIEGAFEVQGRLLHVGDALAVWNTPGVEIEAFSNQAIILVIEQIPGG